MVDDISKDLDAYSMSSVRNYSTLNFNPNRLNETASSSMSISIDANISAMQFHKTQLFLKTNESCSLKGNQICGITETRMELEESDKIETNKKIVQNSGKRIM